MGKLFADKRISFPDPSRAFEDGIVDMNDDLRIERLLEAYSFGIFPWPHEDLPTLWFCPEQRGILEFKDFHISRSLQKELAQSDCSFTFDKAFSLVTEECSKAPRVGQDGTWISSRIRAAYLEFHKAGYAHSLEVWRDEQLVGGLYGVYVGGVFSGESMFFKEQNASKIAVVKLVQYLRAQGLEWMDIQMVTPVMESFGGRYITRSEYLQRLEARKNVAKAIQFVL